MLVAFLVAVVIQIVTMRRMQVTFAAMREHEEQMHLALHLESAVREQYDLEGQFVVGQTLDLAAHDSAKSRALELIRTLGGRLEKTGGSAWMNEIRDASAELDHVFRDQIEPAVRDLDPRASIAHAQSYHHVSRVEENVDGLFERLQLASLRYRQELMDLEKAFLRFELALLVLIPAFVAAAVLYLSRSVARPLAHLSEGAAAIASGELGARIDIDTPDEFGALAAKFNAMTAALRQHQERLVDAEKLAAIGRVAAGVAHELNNPLQVLLGYLSLNRDVDDPRLTRQLATMERETLRCKEIVDGMLDLTRSAPAVTTAPVDLRALCEDVSGSVRVSLRVDSLRLSVDGDAVALADSAKLRQVVFNLVKNAVEAAGPAGDVKVRIGSSGDAVQVAVSDSGPGLPADAKARIFEPFFTTKPKGTGLGLAVSRAITRAHGGDIDVADQDTGGAVFTVRLPRAPERRV